MSASAQYTARMQADRSAAAPPGRVGVDGVALRRTVLRLLAAGAPPWLHQEAARRMAERLPLMRLQPQTVLDWSGPLGASAGLLQQAYPRALLVPVQLTEQLARAAAPAKAGAAGWWPWRRSPRAAAGVVEGEVVTGSAQLLWSNMLLHARMDPQALFARWHAAIAVGGFLMFSTLGPGSLTDLQPLFRRHGWGEPFAPFVDMHDLGDMLVQAGFADPVMDQEVLTLSWPDAGALLAELRALGGNVASARRAGLCTPRWRQQLIEALMASAAGGRPQLRFELVYGHAFRVAPRPTLQAETAVSLDDMRAMVRSPRG